jgi:hypothetical protein
MLQLASDPTYTALKLNAFHNFGIDKLITVGDQ